MGAVLLAVSTGLAAPATTIRVIQPAGGESWSAGTTVSVAWSSSNPNGYVDLQLERGETPVASIGYAPMIQGHANWEICEALGDGADYRVRIIGEDAGGTPVDEVSEEFSISGSVVRPTLAVTSPAVGESWSPGTVQTVTWTSTDPVGAVYVDLLKGGILKRTLGYVPMSEGALTWDPVMPVGGGDDYSVRVSADGCGEGIDAESELFSIAAGLPVELSLMEPGDGASWIAGSIHPIIWDGLNLEGYAYFDLLREGEWYAYIGRTPAESLTFDWSICPRIGDSAAYRVRAMVYHGGGQVLQVVSDEFAIAGSLPQPVLQVTRPAGGESWWQTSTESVEWSGSNTSGTASIGLIKDGRWFATLGRAPAADGVFAWTVPPEIPYGSDARVAVRLTDCGRSIESVSEAFTIGVTPFDLDLDGDVDQHDFTIFESCAAGPTVPLTGDGCGRADFDGDGDVDQSDFAALQVCMSGPDLPAAAGCGASE